MTVTPIEVGDEVFFYSKRGKTKHGQLFKGVVRELFINEFGTYANIVALPTARIGYGVKTKRIENVKLLSEFEEQKKEGFDE